MAPQKLPQPKPGAPSPAPRRAGAVDTHDLQAPEFYKPLGYSVFGVVEGIGGRYNRYYLRKLLANDA